MRLLTFLLFQLFAFTLFSQISFEKGYFVANDGTKTECYIKNLDWKNNPNSITYRINENDSNKNVSIGEIEEFGIDNISKYIRSTVQVDESSSNLDKLSYVKEPEMIEKTVFLNVLVEGEATLYSYTKKNLVRYFYSHQGGQMEPLIYKKYVLNSGKVRINNSFKQQLWSNLECDKMVSTALDKLEYTQSDLVDYIVNYNDCVGSDQVTYGDGNKIVVNISIRPGLNFASLELSDGFNFGTNPGWRIGAEVEFVLPFQKNKWAIVIDPTIQKYNTTSSLSGEQRSISYNSLEVPLGVRHYFFMKEQGKLYLNLLGVFDFPFTENTVNIFSTDLTLSGSANLAFGFGYDTGKKLNLELRYQTARDLLTAAPSVYANFRQISLIAGYTLNSPKN